MNTKPHADEENDGSEDEKAHWWSVMRHLLHYVDFFELDLERRQRHLNRLSSAQIDRLPAITFEKFSGLHQRASVNQYFFDDMVHFYSSNAFVDPPRYAIEHVRKMKKTDDDNRLSVVLPLKDVGPAVQISQQHRNTAVLHSLYREWSEEGRVEREQCFQPILQQLEQHLPLNNTEGKKYYRVSVPGCGLGRLPLEIASRGYCCEGNEFSAYMVIASNFMLNGVFEKASYDIAPWIGNICNVIKVEDTLRAVKIPDIPAVDMIDTSQDDPQCPFPKFSFAAGNFVEIYGDEDNVGAWDCIVTCFFIDTAPVVLDYIDTIHRMLKPGGIWINLGPLLYHWVADVENNDDSRYDQSIELSYEELKHVISTYGFEVLHEEFKQCGYAKFANSMMFTEYNTVLFTARKPEK